MGLFMHLHGPVTDCYRLARTAVHSYNGRLINYYLVIDHDECIGRAKVNCQFLLKKFKEVQLYSLFESEGSLVLYSKIAQNYAGFW